MKYTANKTKEFRLRGTGKQGRGLSMDNFYASDILKQVIWPQFLLHFKSDTTKASYEADLTEFLNFIKKDFLDMKRGDADRFFMYLQRKVKAGVLRASTVSKKIRELHSLAAYILENQQELEVILRADYRDWFAEYLPKLERQEKFVKMVPLADIDRLLQAARDDILAYTILVLLYRVGLSATEITGLYPEDFGRYEEGVYVFTKKRKEPAYVPEDAWRVVEAYLAEKGKSEKEPESEFLFLNGQGRPLNLMYISRMLKKTEEKAGTPFYSAQQLRNSCGVTLYAYGAESGQVASSLGITQTQIRRYRNLTYRDQIKKEAGQLVMLAVLPPRGECR